MPNWVHNSMVITGAAAEIARFKQTCIRLRPTASGFEFDFNLEALAVDCHRANRLRVYEHAADCFECSFETAWGTPVEMWEKLGAMFPKLDFEMFGGETMRDETPVGFRGTIKDGQLELHDVATVWPTKTAREWETRVELGEEMKILHGTRAEIEAMFGGKDGVIVLGSEATE